jgi:hypothetical protein
MVGMDVPNLSMELDDKAERWFAEIEEIDQMDHES